MRHTHFFDAINDDDATTANEALAGLGTMRLAETFAHASTLGPNHALPFVTAQIDALPPKSLVRYPLSRICEEIKAVLVHETPIRDSQLAPVIAAYGRALETAAQWWLALDVYGTLEAVAQAADDMDLVIHAVRRRVFCFRSLEDYASAEVESMRLGELAVEHGDHATVLDAKLALARVALDQGRTEVADGLLREVAAEARERKLEGLLGRTMIDLSRAASLAGDHESALRLAREAYALAVDHREQDRALVNVALALKNLGEFAAARDTNLLLASTGQEVETRTVASIHLMELAALLGDHLQFEQRRRDLAESAEVPLLRVQYLEALAKGFFAFGERQNARVAWLELSSLAPQFGFTDFAAMADAWLHPLRLEGRNAPTPARREFVEAVAREIRERLDAVAR